VRRLRREGAFGLLYGNGGHCTHNHALVLSKQPVEGVTFPQDFHFQELADARRGPVPEIGDAYAGPATLETYTVIYDRDGSPTHGIVLARAPDGSRIAAQVDGTDEAGIAFLTDGRAEPVGSQGRTKRIGDTLHWQGNPA
jgi:acetyl-CoA C-acetyltransferase